MNSYTKVIPALFILAACGGSASSPDGQVPTKIPLSCTASVNQGTVPYSVVGANLNFAGITLPRLATGAAGRAVYGLWLLADQTQAGLTAKGTLEVDPSAVTVKVDCTYTDGRSTTAMASSPATITDTDITIAQSKTVTIPFAMDSGEGAGATF